MHSTVQCHAALLFDGRHPQRFVRAKGPAVAVKSKTSSTSIHEPEAAEFNGRVQANRLRVAAELPSSYDFIVCGAGSSLSKSRPDKRHA
jgi:hypothetical protein